MQRCRPVMTAWSRRWRRACLAAIATFMAVTAAACSSTAAPSAPETSSATTRPSPGSSIDGPQIDQMPIVPGPSIRPDALGASALNVQMATVAHVFADIQSMWEREFAATGRTYVPAQLALFESWVSTACGTETANVGSFYCSGDRTVYLDSQFFSAMKEQFGVRGDFAEIYVIAHEIGHHIQNLVGITSRVAAADRADPARQNALSVRVELQADCLAGVWAHSTFPPSLPAPDGDMKQTLHAAQVVGDDLLAHASGSAVSPDSWSRGSAAQRQQWFMTGYTDGRPAACDTFATS